MKVYGGFVGGKIDWRIVDDKWGGLHHRMSPALFKSRKEGRIQYQDVRCVEIKEVPRKRQSKR